MAKVTDKNGVFSLGVRGKLGKPNGLGETWLGWTELGEDNIRFGYYQYHWNGIGKYYNKAKFYWNPPHTTDKYIAWTTLFGQGVSDWHDLSDEDKLAYNELKYPPAQSGFNRFMSRYLKDRRESSTFSYLLPRYF